MDYEDPYSSEEYKSQHMKIKSKTSIKKSKVEYICEWILESQEEHVLERNWVVKWLYSE